MFMLNLYTQEIHNMKKLDKGDKMIIASVILAIGIVLGAYFMANPKSELQQCIDTHKKTGLKQQPSPIFFCAEIIRGK